MNNIFSETLGAREIIQLVALIFSIIFFILNIIILKRNNNIGIKRSIDLNFYDLTLIKSLKDYFSYIGIINTEYSKLVNEYIKTDNEEMCKTLTEKAINELDKIYEKCENEISPYITGFSIDVNSEINKVFEEYYDSTTTIFSEYSQPLLNQSKLMKIRKKYSEGRIKFISDLYRIIKGYCPK